jgi:hypothetical protein
MSIIKGAVWAAVGNPSPKYAVKPEKSPASDRGSGPTEAVPTPPHRPCGEPARRQYEGGKVTPGRPGGQRLPCVVAAEVPAGPPSPSPRGSTRMECPESVRSIRRVGSGADTREYRVYGACDECNVAVSRAARCSAKGVVRLAGVLIGR